MSRDIKYIGMDVHKDAIVIAVLSGGGKLVMESIVETKARSILRAPTRSLIRLTRLWAHSDRSPPAVNFRSFSLRVVD
jgi:hypothetical protein